LTNRKEVKDHKIGRDVSGCEGKSLRVEEKERKKKGKGKKN
jgi:hypothetical protein